MCRFSVVQIIVVLKCRVITDWTKKESGRFKINATLVLMSFLFCFPIKNVSLAAFKNNQAVKH